MRDFYDNPFDLTEDEVDYLYRSGFTGLSNAVTHYAMECDTKILPIVDKPKVEEALVREIQIQTFYWQFKKAAKKKGNMELFRQLEKRLEDIVKKYNLRHNEKLRIDYYEVYDKDENENK